MASGPVRAGAEWLRLREPSDAAARSRELVAEAGAGLSGAGGVVIHDLGCGSGSMARWLSRQLPGPQRWIMFDRDSELLALAVADAPSRASDGAPVSVETRRRDITRLGPGEWSGADLIAASALLDVLTAEELGRLIVACATAGCPVLIALSVTGQVELSPADPFDRSVEAAFNAHQQRAAGAGRLLGPAAVAAAVDGFTRLGLDVVVRPTPWRLGPDQSELASAWLTGWLAAAYEQHPDLRADAAEYAHRRLAQAASGGLAVTVHHQDLLARPG